MPATAQIALNFACLRRQLAAGHFRKAWFHVAGLRRGLVELLTSFEAVTVYLILLATLFFAASVASYFVPH